MIAAFSRTIAVAMLVAASLVGSPAIAAPSDPVAFVKRLYALPKLWLSMVSTADDRRQYLTLQLGPLVGNNRQGDFRDNLTYDPLADSRPFQLSDESFTLVGSDDSGTSVKVDFKNFGHPDTVTLKLVSSGDGWLLADVAFSDGRTLLTDLVRTC